MDFKWFASFWELTYENKMTLYYEPDNQPGSELVQKTGLFCDPVHQFLEAIDLEGNTDPETMRRLSLADRADLVPPATVDPRMIVVDGPIGAGKSTFCRRLADYATDCNLRVAIIEEVVAKEDFCAYGISLEEYYSDPAANAYRFQLAVTHALADQLLEYRFTDRYKDYDLVIFDRWLPSTSAFILFQMKEGHISCRQAMYLHYLIDVYMSYAAVLPGTHIRFATDPLVCEQRIAQRAEMFEHRVCERDAMEVVRRTNEHILEHRGVYTPLFNLNYADRNKPSHLISAGNQFALYNASRATQQFVINDTLYLGEDRRYFVQIGLRRINAFRLFAMVCDWCSFWRCRDPAKRRSLLTLTFEEFESSLGVAFSPPSDFDE